MQLGIGISTFTEMCGLAPSRTLGALSYGAGGWEHAAIRMLPTGKVEVVTGSSPHGQGHETAWSQIVADQLGVPFEDVEILHGDTQTSPRGLDTYGSRSLAVGAIAVVKAAEKVIAKARPIAAHMMECAEDDLEFTDGRFRVTGTEKAVTLADVALAVFAAHDLPDGVEPNLDSEATYDPENFSFPHGTHLCATEVDTETGQVRIRSYVCVDDIGHVVNPLIVDGQVHGGLAQGIAQALVRGGRARRVGHTAVRLVRRLPAAVGGRSAVVHHRTNRNPRHHKPARRQGRRRGGHDRVHPGGRQRRRSMRCAISGSATSKCLARPMRVWRTQPMPNRHRGRCQMIPSNFDYVAPTTVDDAVAALSQAGEDAKVIAGGQSLMPVLRLRLAAPTVLVDLGRIDELRGVRDDGDSIVIGAMTTYYNLLRNPLVSRHALLLADATATVCGPADPASWDAGRRGGARGSGGRPVCAGARVGATMTAAGPVRPAQHPGGGILRGLLHHGTATGRNPHRDTDPKHTDWAAHYEKLNRVAQAWSIVAVAATVALDGGVIRQASVALTNMASVPVRARGVEQALIGQAASPELIRAAAEHAAEGTDPMTATAMPTPTTAATLRRC